MVGLRQDRSSWLLALFLLVAVLLPSGSVLWFMNEAARSQAESARQRVSEAYRGQLRLQRDRVDDAWTARSAALDGAVGFLPALDASGADSVILLDPHGLPLYPSLPPTPPTDPALNQPGWQRALALEGSGQSLEAAGLWEALVDAERDGALAARAAQSRIRSLMRAGRKEAALEAIQRYFGSSSLSPAADLDGRLIAADEKLLALQLLPRGDRRFAAIAQRLATALNDYSVQMPSAQRLFLMDQLLVLAPESANFSSRPAEHLAEQVLEAGLARAGGAGLEASGLPDLWKLTPPNRRAIALYRGRTVMAFLQRMLHEQAPAHGVQFAVTPPGAAVTGEAIAAGSMLPGWQISFTLLDQTALQEAARRRTAVYVWLGGAVIAAALMAGLFAAQFFRRQARVNRLKTDLLAAVSHELKTPLASMRLLLETLLEGERPDASTTREYLQLIAGENLRLARLVENFLTFSRIERNRQRFEFTQTSAGAVVQAAMDAMRERLHAPDCQFAVEVSRDLPPVLADPDALTTVLLNLLDNAYKYTPAEKRIRVRAYQEDGRLVFDVEDNGIGIAPRDQRRIFRRFYQVDRRLARETGGCGLGLSIVEFIVRAHGGEVKVDSRPGAGSTFHVRLPLRPRARGAAAA